MRGGCASDAVPFLDEAVCDTGPVQVAEGSLDACCNDTTDCIEHKLMSCVYATVLSSRCRSLLLRLPGLS